MVGGPISPSLCLGDIASVKEMSTVARQPFMSDLSGQDLNLRPPSLETNVLLLYQLAGLFAFPLFQS